MQHVCFNPHPSRRTGATGLAHRYRYATWLFQSSPVPKDGCNQLLPVELPEPKCFNPHPSRRTGATYEEPEMFEEYQRFQSSPVPKDGCNRWFLSLHYDLRGFNPHPSRRTGATSGDLQGYDRCSRVSILTRPEGRVQPPPANGATCGCMFQSSPVPKDGCNYGPAFVPREVQGFNPHPSRRTGATSGHEAIFKLNRDVSILTRPEGRVQLMRFRVASLHPVKFQSSPVPKDGCNLGAATFLPSDTVFQSSPVPKDGCNRFLCRCTAALPFQSSPVPKDGCNTSTCAQRNALSVFQSSPVPKDGCNFLPNSFANRIVCFNPHPSRRTGATLFGAQQHSAHRRVSILTRPEGRVQPLQRNQRYPVPLGFNPHPSRRTGATHLALRLSHKVDVSILTRPEGRVQPAPSPAIAHP